MRRKSTFGEAAQYTIYILLVTVCANYRSLFPEAVNGFTISAGILALLLVNLAPAFPCFRSSGRRLKICCHGVICLRIFTWASFLSVLVQLALACLRIPDQVQGFLTGAAICCAILAVIFWNGILCIYFTSIQLGLRMRILGAVFGLVPVLNLFILRKMIKTVDSEIYVETEKNLLNAQRKDAQICRTKYPLLLVHGVFFRDYKCPNYWGRIPAELIKNGAEIFYGNNQSAASVRESAAELAERIQEIAIRKGYGKVNIIAHSKGGLDSRYAASCCGVLNCIASITTISTPHKGCGFADYLLHTVPVKIQKKIESAYNKTLKKLGDQNPDFMAAVKDLTEKNCAELNQAMRIGNIENKIFCQSVGSKLNRAANGKFPLNFTYPLVKYFDGPNDGLVSVDSFPFGERFQFLTVKGNRGISHGDVIDLNRENIPNFDVREFYVQLIADLKNRGL